MNEAEKIEVKEYIDQALVVGKADASNMADHILKKIDSGLNAGIEKYINGNLRDIKEHLTKQDEKLANLENNFNTFRGEVDPLLRAFKDSENTKIVWTKTGVTIKTTAGWIIVVSGAFAVLYGILKYGAKLLMK